MPPVSSATASHVMHATVGAGTGVLDTTLARVALALRGARARTGMSEERTLAVLSERGVAVSVRALRHAEHTGELDFALASCLADAYGTTTDCLAGRRPDRRHQNPLDTSSR